MPAQSTPRAKHFPLENSGIPLARKKSPSGKYLPPAFALRSSPLSIPAAAASAPAPTRSTSSPPQQSAPSPPFGQSALLPNPATGLPAPPLLPIQSRAPPPAAPSAAESPK